MSENRLTMGMYGGEFSQMPEDSTLFGLQTGQMRSKIGTDRPLVKNASWYNAHGHKLGWGDFSPIDVKAVATELRNNELFIVLTEHDSHHPFVTEHSSLAVGSLSKVDSTEEHMPGQEYVAARAVLALTCNTMFDTRHYGTVSRFHENYPEFYPELEIIDCDNIELYLHMQALTNIDPET